ncbi:major facilitator superfamily MFS_1 [Desulfatibacillum aliphaticivorans]|uniref:Major facilitator superfamily MFS_1 n=1 Tax=Desulfatibacillum aliphaticivorans TaxID=218208 RepID=B8FKI6_DESAL|nr:MFS transporter [Desulfatibacillum aliphaticivorans]ACL01801.1 major facilitator superfamily MFS_1 [Desulfatibacillum aliphaticivorans]
MAKSSSGILVLLSVSVGVSMIGLGIIWPLIPVYAVELGAGGFMVGLIIASFNLSKAAFGPFMGRFSDSLGRKKFITVGLIAYTCMSVMYVLAGSAETLIAVRIFHGMASVMVVPIAMALAADIAPKHELGLYMGTLNMAVMLGLGAGPVLGGALRDHFGMDSAFIAMGLLALITCILVVIVIPSDAETRSFKENQARSSVGQIVRHRIALGIIFMRFLAASGQGAVYTFLPLLGLKMDMSSSQVGILLSANIFLIAFLQRFSGRLADRVNPKYLVIFGTFLAGFAVLGMPMVKGFFLVLVLNIVMGAANGLALPGGLVITAQLGRTMGMASLMSITDAAWSLGMIVSPILSGIILDVYGLPYVFLMGSALILTGGAAVSLFLRTYDPAKEY